MVAHPPTQPSLRRLRKLACYGHLLPTCGREKGKYGEAGA